MAAGQGFKTFTTGEVLTAGDVNGYLMQGINVFANATARDAAITSPQEGQFAYTKDNNSLWYYTGSAWAASGATGDIEGVTAGTGLTGGGTSGTVTVSLDTTSAYVVPSQTGNSGKYLTTNGTSSSWATVSAGGMTLISTVTASGATGASFTSIPTTYKHLFLTWDSCKTNTQNTYFYMRVNNDSNSYYVWRTRYVSAGYANDWFSSDSGWWFSANQNEAPIGANTSNNAGYWFSGNMWIYDYTQTSGGKTMEMTSTGLNTDTGQNTFVHAAGSWVGSNAITQIDLLRSGSQTLTGTIRLYGVA